TCQAAQGNPASAPCSPRRGEAPSGMRRCSRWGTARPPPRICAAAHVRGSVPASVMWPTALRGLSFRGPSLGDWTHNGELRQRTTFIAHWAERRLSMLERYFIRPETIDRIRASWIKEPIEQYVAWLTERGCAPRTFCHRVPILRQFGEFARARGASTWEALPEHLDAFVSAWVRERARQRGLQEPRPRLASEVRRPIEQMLCRVVPGFTGRGRPRRSATPFHDQVPGFFAALRQECGLREETVRHYGHHLARFEAYLGAHGLRDLRSLSAVIVSGFLTESSPGLAKTSLRDRCGVLRVFLRHLHRERLLPADLSGAVEAPNVYRLAGLPRSITWDEVRHVLEVVDRRTPTGQP